MEKKYTFAEALELARYLKARGADDATITARLQEKGADPEAIRAIDQQMTKLRLARKRSRGVSFVFIGSFILVFGFIVTFFLFHSEGPMSYVMYSLTTAGCVLLIIGLIDIFG